MVAANLIDGCVFIAASAGMGSFVVAAPSAGWRTPAQAGALDGGTYRYRAYNFDQSQWEIGTGVYTSATQTLTRAIILASSATIPTDKMNFAAAPTVALTVHAEDFLTVAAIAGKVDEAPADGKTYGRKDLGWTDITASLTGFVLKAGDTMTGPLKLPAGSAAAPALQLGDVAVGLFGVGNNQLSLSVGGSARFNIFSTSMSATVPLRIPAGSAGAPSIAPSTDTNTGLYRANPGSMGMSANGTLVMAWGQLVNASYVPITLPGAPTIDLHAATKKYVDDAAAAAAAVDATKVAKAGDTMTGDLTISKVGAHVTLLLEKQPGFYAGLAGGVAGKFRWGLQLGNNEAESGGNAGSNFNFDRYADDGNYLGTALNINRATGDMLTQGNMTWDKANPDLILNKKASGQGIRLASLMANKNRWWLHFGNSEGESGANAGSNFVLYAYDDAGNDLGEALRIARATKNVALGGALALAAGNLTIGSKAYPTVQLQKTAGSAAQLVGAQGTSVRWVNELGGAGAESGGNAGSDWNLSRWSDAGAWIDNVLTITRAGAAAVGSVIATAAQYWANTAGKLLTVDGLWASAVPVTVAYAASLTLNFSSGINFAINPVSGALTLANPLNAKAGQSGFIWLGATGNHALAFGTSWWFPPGGKPTAMGSNDVLHYEVLNSGVLFCSYVKSYA